MQSTPPSSAMADYLAGFSVLEGADQERHHLAAGDPKLCITLGSQADLKDAHGRRIALPKVALLGPHFCAHEVQLYAKTRLLIIELKPSGWWALTRQPAAALANHVIDAAELGQNPAALMAISLHQSATLDALAAAAEAALQPWLVRTPCRNSWLIQAVQQWLAASANPQIGDLLAQTGLSPSQAQRQMKALFGGPPKLLARRHRALKAAAAIAAGQACTRDKLAELFYDQSHLIREIKQFTGLTPGQIRKSLRPELSRPPKVEG